MKALRGQLIVSLIFLVLIAAMLLTSCERPAITKTVVNKVSFVSGKYHDDRWLLIADDNTVCSVGVGFYMNTAIGSRVTCGYWGTR